MTCLLALPTGFARRICALCSSVVMLTSAAALAQSADPATPPPPSQSSVQDEASGSCEPIGLTASGEVVFPFRCKEMVGQQRAAATKPADPAPAVTSAVQENAQETSQEKLHEAHQQTPQAKPQEQPVAAAKTAASHPARMVPETAKLATAKLATAKPATAKPAAAKPAAQPIDVAHLPKTANAKTVDAKTVDGKTVDTKTVDTKKGIQQVAGAVHQRGIGPPGCTHFQSYNAVSATYLGFDGQRHPCRDAVGQATRNQVAGNQAARTQPPAKPSPADIKH